MDKEQAEQAFDELTRGLAAGGAGMSRRGLLGRLARVALGGLAAPLLAGRAAEAKPPGGTPGGPPLRRLCSSFKYNLCMAEAEETYTLANKTCGEFEDKNAKIICQNAASFVYARAREQCAVDQQCADHEQCLNDRCCTEGNCCTPGVTKYCIGATIESPGICCDVKVDCCGGTCCDDGRQCCRGGSAFEGFKYTCSNPQTDSKNCSACGNKCNDDQLCCKGSCIGVKADPNNCGSCGNACAPGQSCCNGSCVNTAVDLNHCGGCGATCDPDTEHCCNGKCVETTDDPSNCGGCGKACGSGQVCCNSQCMGAGTEMCGDTCCDPTQCKTCQFGGLSFSCVSECVEGETCCNGKCCDTAGSFACVDGQCVPKACPTCEERNPETGQCTPVDCGSPCLECQDNSCVPKTCPTCEECNPATGACEPVDCGSPCLECQDNSCVPKTCGECETCDEATGECQPACEPVDCVNGKCLPPCNSATAAPGALMAGAAGLTYSGAAAAADAPVETRCGETCCDTSVNACVDGQCVPACGGAVCGPGEACCNGEGQNGKCQRADIACCAKGTTLCYPDGATNTNWLCCPEGWPCCFDGRVGANGYKWATCCAQNNCYNCVASDFKCCNGMCMGVNDLCCPLGESSCDGTFGKECCEPGKNCNVVWDSTRGYYVRKCA